MTLERNSDDLSHLNDDASGRGVAAQHGPHRVACASCLAYADAEGYCGECDVVTLEVEVASTPATLHFRCDRMPLVTRRTVTRRAMAALGCRGPLDADGLTVRQAEVLRFVSGYRDVRGYAPTLREIGRQFGIGSTNGVGDHLRALERKGYIRRDPTVSRGIVVLREPEVRA